jgi:outer membrane protein assembly factor BamD
MATQFAKESNEVLTIMNDARLAQEENRHGTALSKYEHVYKKFPDSIFAPEAYFQTGKIKVERGKFKEAFKAFDEIIKKYPKYSRFNEVLHEGFEIARLVKNREQPKFFGVIPGFKDYQAAINFYKNIIDNAPFGDVATLALMHMGEFAFNANKITDAIAAFERVIDDYPYSEYAPEAYLKLGEIYAGMVKSPLYDQGATRLAINYYEDFLTLYPNHERADEAKAVQSAMKARLAESKLLIGDFYFNARNNAKAAVIMYKKSAKSLPGSDIEAKAKERIQYIRDGNLPKKTPVDVLFGRYERPSNEQIVAATESGDDNAIEFPTDLVRINHHDDVFDKKTSNPDVVKPDESFLQIGPQKTF